MERGSFFNSMHDVYYIRWYVVRYKAIVEMSDLIHMYKIKTVNLMLNLECLIANIIT